MRIGLVQHPCGPDAAPNLQRSLDGVRQAAGRGAGLVLLPELHALPYFPLDEDPAHFALAEPVPGPVTSVLGELAAELDVVIVGSVFERRAGGVFHNTAVVLDTDGRLAGRYRKMHIPHDPGYFEKYYFTPGDRGFMPIDTAAGRLGVLTCWDQWFPEAARLMALAGAQILLYPTAIGWNPEDPPEVRRRELDAWVTVQRSHGIANQLPVAACNRIGTETGRTGHCTRFWGNSFVCGPQGEMLVQADPARDEVIVADTGDGGTISRDWPFFRDRRIDAYRGLLQRVID